MNDFQKGFLAACGIILVCKVVYKRGKKAALKEGEWVIRIEKIPKEESKEES